MSNHPNDLAESFGLTFEHNTGAISAVNPFLSATGTERLCFSNVELRSIVPCIR